MKSESKIQQEIFRWFWNNYCLTSHKPRGIMYHVPNEGANNGRLVPIGLYSGCADLVFTYKGEHYYCEVKDATGKQSPNQLKFQKHIEDCGHVYFVVRSLEEFITKLESL